ncbi:MAG: cobalamin B12-binding domain-containing protein [Desulfotignum sp.]|nr:cobalamin B12-binding domain-containing protein [Desulfotignum sp.]MCF8136417.1 cobalamin B12-binding domain-containing protein [Desulfotignum sp.]
MDEGTINDLPHTGLGILASELKEYGEQIVFIDNHFAPVPDEDVSDYISTLQPDTICLSLVSSEWLLERTQNLINEAHSKGIEVWVGGPHAYGYGDLLVNDERITKIVIGEIDGQID